MKKNEIVEHVVRKKLVVATTAMLKVLKANSFAYCHFVLLHKIKTGFLFSFAKKISIFLPHFCTNFSGLETCLTLLLKDG